MTTRDTNTDRLELLKWISERNAHIPMSDLAFLMGVSSFEWQGAGQQPAAQELEPALC